MLMISASTHQLFPDKAIDVKFQGFVSSSAKEKALDQIENLYLKYNLTSVNVSFATTYGLTRGNKLSPKHNNFRSIEVLSSFVDSATLDDKARFASELSAKLSCDAIVDHKQKRMFIDRKKAKAAIKKPKALDEFIETINKQYKLQKRYAVVKRTEDAKNMRGPQDN